MGRLQALTHKGLADICIDIFIQDKTKQPLEPKGPGPRMGHGGCGVKAHVASHQTPPVGIASRLWYGPRRPNVCRIHVRSVLYIVIDMYIEDAARDRRILGTRSNT